MSQSTTSSVLDSVRALIPEIGAAAADVDRNRAVDQRVIERLHDTGYFSLLRPQGSGRPGGEPDDYLTATFELSAACMSTGWLAGWLALNSWGLSVRNAKVQQEIWGAEPRTLLCSSYAPTGRLEAIDGGFWLSGRWSRCTGAHHASWLSAAALRVGPDGAAQDFMAVLVPRADYVIESTWNGLGLRGISADDVVISGVFVPEHRAFSWMNFDPTAATPLDRLPQPTLYTLAGTIPLLGAAQRVLATRVPASATPLDPVAMARADVELSVLQIRRNLADLMACVRVGDYPDAELVLRARRDQVMASERAVGAIRTVVHNPGTLADHTLLERIWRDVQTAQRHVSSNVEQVLSVVGRFAMGLNVDDLIW